MSPRAEAGSEQVRGEIASSGDGGEAGTGRWLWSETDDLTAPNSSASSHVFTVGSRVLSISCTSSLISCPAPSC